MLRSVAMASNRGRLLRGMAVSVTFGAAFAVAFAARHGVEAFFVSWAISVMYSIAIGLPAMLIFGRMKPWLAGKPELRQWLSYFGVLLVLSVVGSFVVGLAAIAIGWVEFAALWDFYVNGLKIALAIALPVTIGAMSLSRLHTRIAETERTATEAKLASLESRVRPHFLFNALNSAIALIPEDPQRAEAVLQRLAGLLRFSLDAKGSVALGEELRVVGDYLEIERVRFGDRLRYELDSPAELAAVRIPAFAVQTLVENSVKYAVAPRTTGAAIRVRVRRDGERLAIEVHDDGPGFSGEIWRPGHGLEGLRARLDALYGVGGVLIAPAAAEIGAAVRIELPAGAG
jgi:signal transduction histidine kinase